MKLLRAQVSIQTIHVRQATFTVFRSRSLNRKQRYYWKLVHKNGEHLAGSKEGYMSEREAYEIGKNVVSGTYWSEAPGEESS